MALFNKFFFSSNKRKSNSNSTHNNLGPHFPFNSNQVRILLYRECDATGRRLLFDSNSIQEIAINNNQKPNTKANKTTFLDNLKNQKTTTKGESFFSDGNFIEISNGIGYKHIRPTASDISNIGEMIFGALAMSFRSPSLKVHWLQAPTRLMCSQVFLSPIPGTNTGCLLNQTDLLGISSNSNSNLKSKLKIKNESSESFDGYSVSSFSTPFSSIKDNHNISLQFAKHPTISDVSVIKNLDCYQGEDVVHLNNKRGPATTTQSLDAATPTIGSDSGCATISECWTSRSSYQYSTRSSMGSVLSDPLSGCDSLRKFSIDSSKSNYNEGTIINNNFTSTSLLRQPHSKASNMSISRRVTRNMQTSFENRNSICDFVGFICDNYHIGAHIQATKGGSDGCVVPHCNTPRPKEACETHSNPEIFKSNTADGSGSILNCLGVSRKYVSNKNNKSLSKRSKLGLAICISITESHKKEMEKFCCEHIALLESMLSRLRASAEYAYLNHKRFLKIMLHAWQKTAEWISDFFTVPRLPIPIWYNFTCSKVKSNKQIDQFLKEFCWLLKTYDSKDTNFFISTIVTAILTHHLGWVASVTTIPTRKTTNENNHSQSPTQQFSYNPLWAQMCDLYGALGHPPKVSRTIVTGRDKNIMGKILQVLTYFIRSGTVSQKRIKNELKIDSVTTLHRDRKGSKSCDGFVMSKKKNGLSRNSTIHNNLSNFSSADSLEEVAKQCTKENKDPKIKNFNDTKITRKNVHLSSLAIEKVVLESKEKIKLTVTTPEDVEMVLDDEIFSSYPNSETITENCEALEAIEIQDTVELNVISKFSSPNVIDKLNFWNLEPNVKEGLSWLDVAKIKAQSKAKDVLDVERNPNCLQIFDQTSLESKIHKKASMPNEMKNKSLSNLITENSIGKSERFVWGIEPLKENVCLEEEKHFEITQKLMQKDRSFVNQKDEIVNQERGKGVLFVLGDNEHLVNIKKSSENLSPSVAERPTHHKAETNQHKNKYSGVKFNIDEYSESATNFLNKKIYFEPPHYELKSQKTQKIEKSVTDFWTKCTCDIKINGPKASNTSFDLNKNESHTDLEASKVSLYACEFCKTNPIDKELKVADQISKMTIESSEKIKSRIVTAEESNNISEIRNSKKPEFKDENINTLPISSRGLHLKKMFRNIKNKKLENLNLKVVPIPDIETRSDSLSNSMQYLDKSVGNHCDSGYIPSLLGGISDRYIPDMVLQGTVSPFSTWETNVKNDLIIASHCASLISQPTENVAIVADLDKWEIKIISSQHNILPYTSALNGPVGMSQLVSQLLEGFCIMWNSGISSTECLGYLETKLQEIYLQSETLAGLLLTTEFCSLNSITSALDLAENDVPLLLAIASIHSPQVTKRYGISFG